jgi:phage virion morphogenesis protein
MIELKVDAAPVTAAMTRLAKFAGDASPLMAQIAGVMHDASMENFSQHGRPAWMGLAPSTLKEKRKKGYSDDPLIRSGKLRTSITMRYTATTAQVGTNLVYAAIHQFGGNINKAAQSRQVRHRTDAKGELLRTEHFNGKGLIFAKASHKRVQTRWFEQAAHSIAIPARPFLQLTTADEVKIVSKTSSFLAGVIG